MMSVRALVLMSVRSSLTKCVPMFALAAKPNMCTTSRLAAKPNPCFPPSLVKGVEGGTHKTSRDQGRQGGKEWFAEGKYW